MVWLAYGTPPDLRVRTLSNIGPLRQTLQGDLREVTDFIDRENLYRHGLGLVDAVLSASTLLTPREDRWALDKRIATPAKRFNVARQSSLHLLAVG